MQITVEKARFMCFFVMASLVFVVSPCFAAQESMEEQVQQTIQRFQDVEPQTTKHFDTAHGYMVFPRIEKGAAIVGAAYGEGLVYEKKELVGRAKMTHLTLGVQAGGGTYSEVIFFESEAVMNQFREKETIASKQACTHGPHDTNSINMSDRPGLAIYTLNRTGGFLEASAGTKTVTFIPLAQ
jgi:lipid-binding SYLF domain-containing protein